MSRSHTGRRCGALLLGSLTCVLLAACNSTPTEPTRATSYIGGGASGAERLAEAAPVDMAVVPVRNQSGIADVQVDAVRETLTGGLVDRLYSPLAPEFVDRSWSEATWSPESVGADAVLQVVITRWDEGYLGTTGAITIGAEVRIFDGHSDGLDPLWGVDVVRSYAVGALRDRGAPLSELRGHAGSQLGAEIAALVPERAQEG